MWQRMGLFVVGQEDKGERRRHQEQGSTDAKEKLDVFEIRSHHVPTRWGDYEEEKVGKDLNTMTVAASSCRYSPLLI